MVFSIVPPESLWWLYAVLIISAIVMLFGFLSMSKQSRQPNQKKRFVLRCRFILFLSAIMVLVAIWMVYKQSTATLEIADTELKIHAGLYSQKILISDLKIDETRIVNLNDSGHLNPRKRLNGTGAPSLKAGWFALSNGEKAFLLVTRTDKVLYIPSEEFALMVSLNKPDEFLGYLGR